MGALAAGQLRGMLRVAGPVFSRRSDRDPSDERTLVKDQQSRQGIGSGRRDAAVVAATKPVSGCLALRPNLDGTAGLDPFGSSVRLDQRLPTGRLQARSVSPARPQNWMISRPLVPPAS